MKQLLITFLCSSIFAFLSGGSGRNTSSRVTENMSYHPELLRVVKEQIPIGTTRTEAKTFMEQEGFSCKYKTNSTFRYHEVEDDGSRKKIALADIDFLRCNRSEQDFLVKTITTVAIVIEEDRVAKFVGMTSFVGP
jgi:hypothetical protein